MIQLVIFDLAGTTVKDDGQVPRAFEAALARHGVTVTSEAIHGVRGSSKREAIRRFLPPACDGGRRADDAYDGFREHLARLYRTEGVHPIDGAVEMFGWLRSRGVRLALNTGFDRDITRLLLDALGWNAVADAVVCGDDVANGRPAPDMIRHAMHAAGIGDPRHVANVGDTILDLQAAHRAGTAWNIGVLTGAHGREALAAAPHTHLLDSIADLPRLWEPPGA